MEALGTFERQKARLLPAPAGTVFAIPGGRLPAPAASVFIPVFASSSIELSAGPNFRGVVGARLGRQIWEGGDRAGELGVRRGRSPFGLPVAFIAGPEDFGGDGAFRGWAGRIWDGQSAFCDLGVVTGPPQVLSGKSATPPALSPRWRRFWACPSATPPPTGPQRGLAAFGRHRGGGFWSIDRTRGHGPGATTGGAHFQQASRRRLQPQVHRGGGVGSVGDPTGTRATKGAPGFCPRQGRQSPPPPGGNPPGRGPPSPRFSLLCHTVVPSRLGRPRPAALHLGPASVSPHPTAVAPSVSCSHPTRPR